MFLFYRLLDMNSSCRPCHVSAPLPSHNRRNHGVNHYDGCEDHRRERPGRGFHCYDVEYNHEYGCPIEWPHTPPKQIESEKYVCYISDNTNPDNASHQCKNRSHEKGKHPLKELKSSEKEKKDSNEGNMGPPDILHYGILHLRMSFPS